MYNKQEIEKLRDEIYEKALDYQSKSNEAYFADKKLEMNEYSVAFGKALAQYHILVKILGDTE